MTTITIKKSGFKDVTIFTGKVDETLTKDVVSYPYFFGTDAWKVPTNTQPRREVVDFLNVNRVFTVTGLINRHSVSAPASGEPSACYARDELINMARHGGVATFIYGTLTDTQGRDPDGTIVSFYIPSDRNMYYTTDGFSVHFTRIQITETPKGGSSDTPRANNEGGTPHKLPEEYEVTIELMNAYDMGDIPSEA